MSSPYRPEGRADDPTVSFDGGGAGTEAGRPSTQADGSAWAPDLSKPDLSKPDLSKPDVRKPDLDGPDVYAPAAASRTAPDENPAPFTAALPAVEREPDRYGDDRSSSWSNAYPEDTRAPGPAVTSVYPQSTPEYAPAGYPSAYAPATVVPPPASSAIPDKPSSRVGPGFLSAILGLILTAGGLYLLARFGFRAGVSLTQPQGKVSFNNSGLALLGALLLFAATLLNGWSPWSTLLPGIALTGLGGWALFDANAFRHVGQWVRSVLDLSEVTNALVTGFVLALGLVLLGASIAALLARSGGKRDGRILGHRDAASA